MNELLEKLKDLFSKSFVISSFLPVFVCGALNALLLYETNESFRGYVLTAQQPIGTVAGVLQAGAVLFALAVVASLIAPSITFFRGVLEGEYWPSVLIPLRNAMVEFHSKQLHKHEEHTRLMQHDLNLVDGEDWKATLLAANTGTQDGYKAPKDGKLIGAVRLQDIGDVVSFVSLREAHDELKTELQKYKAPDGGDLYERWQQFIRLLDYTNTRLDAEIVQSVAARQQKWGETGVAPTDLGNRARATASYGLLRYGLSLEFGWSRLQKVLQKDDQLKTLQDVKAGFDSVVTLFWLIALTTAGWAFYLVTQVSLWLYVLVVVLGPLACNLLYRTAVSSYVAFGDLLRSTVDLYRFDLLRALHLPLPEGLNEERALWSRVRKQAEFGEKPDVRYEHSESKA